VDTLPNLVVTPSNSFVQILQLPHELQLGQFQHGLHNRQIQHRTAFRVQGAKGFVLAGVCFTRAYPSSKPKASTTLSQYCCHVHRYSEETCSIMSCSSPTPSLHNFIPTLSILAMSRLQNKIVDIYNTHDIRSNEKKWIKLGLLQTASLKLFSDVFPKININRIIVHCTTGAMSQRNQYPRAAYLHERRIEL